MEDMIAEEEVVLTITHKGYIKRTALNTYRTQRRGGRGVQGAMSKEEDFVEHLFIANTHNYMLFFTDQGKCYWLKVYDIPQGGRAARGRAIVNLIGCDPGEKVEAFVSVKEFDDEGRYIEVQFGNLSVISLYAPSGSSGEDRQEAKFRFLKSFKKHLIKILKSKRKYIICLLYTSPSPRD